MYSCQYLTEWISQYCNLVTTSIASVPVRTLKTVPLALQPACYCSFGYYFLVLTDMLVLNGKSLHALEVSLTCLELLSDAAPRVCAR